MLQSITFKVLGIGALALLMLIPLLTVKDLIRERVEQREEALRSIARGWGSDQRVGGPVLAVPRDVEVTKTDGWVMTADGRGAKPAETTSTEQRTEFRLPETLDTTAELAIERRRYSIYEAPVYVAHLHMKARFVAAQLAGLNAPAYHPDGATLRLPIFDLQGLREVVGVRINGSERYFEPGEPVSDTPAVSVPLQATDLKQELLVEVELQLAGTVSLQFMPFARTTTLEVRGPWGDPSFIGAPLPVQHDIKKDAFSARWQALDLNRSYRQSWMAGDAQAQNLGNSAFGVSLFEPGNLYLQNTRAGKYGLLFVALTFIAFFLFEVLKRLRVHPLQYLLVGLALCTFYLVLLALSEQIGFGLAYVIAATAVVLMIAGYAAAVLATWRGGLTLGVILGAVYGLLYGLVVSEQYGLLMGALSLLAVVGLLMYLTRRIDWYAYARA